MLYGYLSQARLVEETMTRTSHPVAVGRPVQPQLLGALHALNGLAIGAVTGWLLSETRRRRATASRGRASRSPA